MSILSFQLRGAYFDKERMFQIGQGWRERQRKWRKKVKLQFFTSLEMFVIIEKVIPALGPGARVYATVLSELRWMRLAKGVAKCFEVTVVIGGRFCSGSRACRRSGEYSSGEPCPLCLDFT